MFPAKIDDYVRPKTVAEALEAIARYGDDEAMFVAGGQSLMQAVKSRMVRPSCLVDLQSIAELRGIDLGQGLTIGAMTRYVEIAECETLPRAYAALNDAAQHVGDRQVRNRGTIGGSICWNFVASCMPAVVLGLNGTVVLASSKGSTREVVAEDFILGPFETAREKDEILLSISWPAPPAHCGSAYKKWGLVADAVPVIGVCVSVTLAAGDTCESARVALSGLADGAQLAPAGAVALVGTDGSDKAIAEAMAAVADSVETHSDHWADGEYRRQLIRGIGTEAAHCAFQRARQETVR